MSKLYNGGASFGFSLNYNTAVPVDTRLVVATLADLKNPETWVSGVYDRENDSNNVYVVYPGLTVTVTSEKTVYVFIGEEVNGTTLSSDASWSKLSTAESTGDTQDAVDKIEESVGLAADGSHVQTSGNYTSDATTVVGEIAALDSALKSTNDKIGESGDTKEQDTVYGSIAKVQDDLNKEKSKIAGSATIKEVENTYETALEFKYVPVSGPDDDVKAPAHLALCDKNGKELSTVDIDLIVGNGTLKESVYNTETGILTLVWNKSDGTTAETPIDLSSMLDINDVLIDSESLKYMSVDLSGGENSQAVFKALIKKVSEATAESTGLADAADVKNFVEASIQSLDKVSTTATGQNIHVTYSEEDGIVSIDSISEDYSTVTRVAHSESENASITVSEGSKLATGSDIEKVAAYTDDKVSEEASRVDSKIANLRGSATGSDGDEANGPKITVKVDSQAGEVSGVTVTTTDIASKAAADALDEYIKGEKVVSGEGKVSGGIEKRVVALEEKNASEDFESSIDKKDSSEYVNVKVSQGKDGKLDPENSSVSVVYASYNPTGEVVTDGVAKGSLVKEIAEDLVNKAVDNLDIDAALEASDVSGKVSVSINQENGKIKDLTVSSDDIASAALLGEKTDDHTKDTAFGKIALEAKTRREAIEALDSEKETTGTNVTVGVKEVDGVITEVTVSEEYSTVTRTAKGESVDPSLVVTNGEKIATGSDIDKVARYSEDIVSKAVEGLDSEKTSADGVNVTVKVSEVDGKIDGVSVTENYATVTRTPKSEDVTEAITVEDKSGLATGEDLEKVINYTLDVTDTAKEVLKSYVDTKTSDLEVTADGDTYVSATQSSSDNKKIEVRSNVVLLENATESVTGLADALNVKTSIATAKKELEDQIEWVEID